MSLSAEQIPLPRERVSTMAHRRPLKISAAKTNKVASHRIRHSADFFRRSLGLHDSLCRRESRWVAIFPIFKLA